MTEAEHILIVDDDLDSLKLISRVLQRQGYQTSEASNGLMALDMMRRNVPNLVLLDIMMPDMDGYDVAREMRADPALAQVSIIMFTAKGMVTDKVEGFDAGADDYLTKPTHPAELTARVRSVLSRASTRIRETVPSSAVKKAHTIAFLGARGGSGTTTVALNTAILMAMASRNGRLPPVTLAEIRPGQGAVGLLLNLSLQVGLSTALEIDPQQLSLESINKHLVMHNSSLRVLLSSVYPAPIDAALTPEFADLLIQALGAEDALLLLDLGHEINDVNRKLLNRVDRIVLVVEPERLSLLRGNQMVIELKRMGISPRAIGGVLVNRMAPHNPISYQKTQDTLGTTLLAVIPPAPELALEAIETITPMVILEPTSLLAEQFKTLARMLIDNRG